jgi:conjugative relaxase-like TrwC/TraI family protein
VTVRVSTLKGGDAGRYYTERLPSYYLDGDEPPGRWWGKAADRLRLHGEIDADPFLAVMAGQDPTTGQDLGRRFGEVSVRGYDATFSAPKSVSVLFGLGDEEIRHQVVEAHERAVEAVLGWVESHAHTRMRHHGHVVTVDAEGIMVGVFRQHTSRAADPQLHTHLVIANRVRSPDRRWLALDARTIKHDQRTLSALYHAGLRAELTRRLGVRWEVPEHGITEVADVAEGVRIEFSRRSGDVQRRTDEKLDRFADAMGREPTPRERWRLEREAVVDSRPAKPRALDADVLHGRWAEQTDALGLDPAVVVRAAVGHVPPGLGIDRSAAAMVVDRAMGNITEGQSTWRPAELVRELVGK